MTSRLFRWMNNPSVKKMSQLYNIPIFVAMKTRKITIVPWILSKLVVESWFQQNLKKWGSDPLSGSLQWFYLFPMWHSTFYVLKISFSRKWLHTNIHVDYQKYVGQHGVFFGGNSIFSPGYQLFKCVNGGFKFGNSPTDRQQKCSSRNSETSTCRKESTSFLYKKIYKGSVTLNLFKC